MTSDNLAPQCNEKKQLDIIAKAKRNKELFDEKLFRRYDFPKGKLSTNDAILFIDNMSKKTANLIKDRQNSQISLLETIANISLQSNHTSVLKKTNEYLDPIVTELTNSQQEQKIHHNALYLSSFGGHLTHDRKDIWHLSYEFNSPNKDALPFNAVENLHMNGLIKEYTNPTFDNNLTILGIAVLQRMNLKFGPSDAQTIENMNNYSHIRPAL